MRFLCGRLQIFSNGGYACFCAFDCAFAANLAPSTIKRRCTPLPITPAASEHVTSNVSARSSTPISVPGADDLHGNRRRAQMLNIQRRADCGASRLQRALRAEVAGFFHQQRHGGRCVHVEPPLPRAAAVFCSVTVSVSVSCKPISSICVLPFCIEKAFGKSIPFFPEGFNRKAGDFRQVHEILTNYFAPGLKIRAKI